MSFIGPFAATEADYRRDRITESFSHHRRTARHLRRRRTTTSAKAIDWFAA